MTEDVVSHTKCKCGYWFAEVVMDIDGDGHYYVTCPECGRTGTKNSVTVEDAVNSFSDDSSVEYQ